MNYKLQLIDTIEEAIKEIDTMPSKEERAKTALWLNKFLNEAAHAVVAYASLGDDMRPIVKKGIIDKHNKVKTFLKGVK